MPKVSVVIPVYNIGNVLERCLDSVVTQSHDNLQILLIDDGSSDNSLAICKRYAKYDKRIEVYHHVNHGVSFTRNVGIQHASGEYIIFIDGDDYISPSYIKQLHDEAIRTKSDIVICGIRSISDGGREEIIFIPCNISHKKTFWEFCCKEQSPLLGYAPNKLYRLELIIDSELKFSISMHAQEDLDFALRAYRVAQKISITKLWGYTYIHEHNIRNMPIDDLIRNQILIYKGASEVGVDIETLSVVCNRICIMLYCYLLSQPNVSHMKYIRHISELNEIIKNKTSNLNPEVKLLVTLYKHNFFNCIQIYTILRRLVKHLIKNN